MRYWNQLNYRHVPYHTHTKMDVPESVKLRNVVRSGCGLCSACMMVELLTNYTLDVVDCVKIAEECEAGHGLGTDMTVLGPVLAKLFGLVYAATDDVEHVKRHLQCGGKVIARLGVPEGQEIGLFTNWEHFVLLDSTDGEEFCILDPSYREGKFDIPERVGKVNTVNAPYLYCDVDVLHRETVSHTAKYYLFSRKKNV